MCGSCRVGPRGTAPAVGWDWDSRMGISQRARRCLTLLIVVALLVGAADATRAPARAEDADQVFFDTTGQVLGGAFLESWTDRGGLEVVGEPVSQPVQQGDRWVQWFKYERLEVSKPLLSDAVPDDVKPASLGRQLQQQLAYLRWHPAFQPVADA